MLFIDTHSHLYSEEFNNDYVDVINRCDEAGVTRLIMPDIDSLSRPAILNLANLYPEKLFPCIGLHPTSVNENYKTELKLIENELASNSKQFCAIGEIGIDLYWDQQFEKEQFDALRIQVEWAKDLNLPVIIHIRNAIDKTIAALEPLADNRLRGVFHCFSGNIEHAQKAINMGFMIGIGGVVTFKKSDLPTIVKEIDLKNILLETDCPYLAPVPHRGKRNESSYIPLIAQTIANIKNISVEEVANVTTQNAEQLFMINVK